MSTQLPVLGVEFARSPVAFDAKLGEHGIDLRAGVVDTLQINVGKLCNQRAVTATSTPDRNAPRS